MIYDNIPLVNISNFRRDIYLFLREEDGRQKIEKISDFYPYFFEPNENGTFLSYDGKKLKKIYASSPNDVPKMRSSESYSSDIKFTNNFIVNRVNSISKTNIKYCFLDIEILAKDLPDAKEAKYPVSCITVYNSFDSKLKTWFLKDYCKEEDLLEDFIKYMQQEKFDIWFSWNVDFDYNYLYFRIMDFAKKISPIGMQRLGTENGILYPSGFSIVDYLKLFKKVNMREASYALDYVAQKYLEEKAWGRSDFSKLTDEIKKKNINDINRMIKLEKMFGIIPYYDELRRMTKVQWEDLYHNSRLIEMILFDEAKKQNIILPNKKDINEIDEVTFQGATRDIEKEGVYFDIGKFDLTSAYPSMIVNFCLDSQNILGEGDEDIWEMEGGFKVNNLYFKNNPDSLLPCVVKKLLLAKDNLKKQKKINPNNKNLKVKYEAIKGIVNSAFGVMGNKYFRLYDSRIASSITFLVRDLLMYVKAKIEQLELKVIYWDTDSVFINTKEDISETLNHFIWEWAKNKGKENIDLAFEYQGYFTKLYISGKCHYYGYVYGEDEPEKKGMEMKRSSSSKYESWFQEELLNKILNKQEKEKILQWIWEEHRRIKTLPLEEVAFPAKIGIGKYESNEPIFLRAHNNSVKLIPGFQVSKGELFHYIFIKPEGYDANKKLVDVIAFIDSKTINKANVDWDRLIFRTIISKSEKIFTSMGWSLLNPEQMVLA